MDGPVEARRCLIESNHPRVSVSRQCALVGLNRSSFYYEPVEVSELNLRLMRWIDRLYTQMPFLGVPKMTALLTREVGVAINHKRVERLMRLMGLQALCPKRPRTSQGDGGTVHPYLLRQMRIERPDQVWCTDITYIPMDRGFLYLVAIMDWFSRYVPAWELSNSRDRSFCITALDRALASGTPEVFHSDQGSQFTSKEFTGRLEAAQIRISMDGRGRFWDNIFIERLWRSVKYEEVYPKEYTDGWEAQEGLARYFRLYNAVRPHQALSYETPEAIYRQEPR